jgi:hypothetical protein
LTNLNDEVGLALETQITGENEETSHPGHCVQDSTGILYPLLSGIASLLYMDRA